MLTWRNSRASGGEKIRLPGKRKAGPGYTWPSRLPDLVFPTEQEKFYFLHL